MYMNRSSFNYLPRLGALPEPRRVLALGVLLMGSTLLTAARIQAQEAGATAAKASHAQVDFARDIVPVLTRNCVACHNAKKAEGGLNLESHASLMLGGDSGPAIVPQDIDESYLHSRVVDEDDPMPPQDNTVGAQALTPDEVALLTQWIVGGALDSAAGSDADMAWQAIPESLSPIYALSSSRDGQALAIGHGNTVQLARPKGGASNLVPQDLIDGNLHLADGTPLSATHLDLVQSLAFSPDSQLLATGGFRTVKLWRRQTAAQRILDGLAINNGLTAVSPTQERLAIVSQETGIELVDLAQSQSHRFLRAHAQPIRALYWLSPTTLLSADAQGGLVITQADNYQAAPLQSAAPAPILKHIVGVGKRVFALDEAGALFEVALASDQPLVETSPAAENLVKFRAVPLSAPASLLASVALPEPSLLVALSDRVLARIALDDGAVLAQWTSEAEVKQLSVSSTGEAVLTIASDGQAHLRKLANGELLVALNQDYTQAAKFHESQRDVARQQAHVDQLVAQLPELQKASEAEVEAHKKVLEAQQQAAAALATQDTALAAARTGHGETEKALAAAQHRVTELMAELEAKQKAIAEAEIKQAAAKAELAARDQALATAADGVQRAAGRIASLETTTAAERELLTAAQTRTQELQTSVAPPPAIAGQFSHDGSAVVIAGSDHGLRLYSAATGQPQANLTGPASPLVAMHSTAAQRLLGLTADGSVLSWDLNLPWQLERTVGSASESLFSDRICALDFSPDGLSLAVGSGPPSRFGDIKLVDVASGQIARDWGEVHSDTVLSVRFSPDGRSLASGGADKLCRLWDVESGEAIRSFEGHTHHVMSIAWQDSGQRLATASADQTIKVWKVESGEQLRTIAGFSHEVTAIAFIGNTAQLIAVAADGSARVLNADDGATLRGLAGAENALYALSISADNLRVSAGGQIGKIWTWLIADGKLVE